jgi:formate hydrogenlyase subunit 4
MQGLTLLATFLVMALISIVVAVFVGVIVDQLPHIHDMLSLLAFFGTLVVLLPIAWFIAVKLTEPRHTVHG